MIEGFESELGDFYEYWIDRLERLTYSPSALSSRTASLIPAF